MEAKHIEKIWKLHDKIEQLQKELDTELASLKAAALQAYSGDKYASGPYRITVSLKRQYKPLQTLKLVRKGEQKLFAMRPKCKVTNVAGLLEAAKAAGICIDHYMEVTEEYYPIDGAYEVASDDTKELIRSLTYSPSVTFK